MLMLEIMNMLNRFVVVRRDCPHCKCYLRVIQEINALLPPEKRISYIEVTDAEDYNFHEPLLTKIKYPGTPTLFMDGIRVVGMTSPFFAKEFLFRLVKEELLL